MIYLSKGGAGADSDHTWIRPCSYHNIIQQIIQNDSTQHGQLILNSLPLLGNTVVGSKVMQGSAKGQFI